ncbi:MAG: hypothetical protein EBX37_18260, partial [Alphaproteobacteria bacterium]|nr:hypothetical protein [Alphaproteobacteria bacterium]
MPSSFVIRILSFGFLLEACAANASAQRYILKDGAALAANDVTVAANALVQEVKITSGGTYERRYPFADIARL